MARPKLIEDITLLELIKEYFYKECNNDIKKLKPPQIVQYINKHGYPDYPASTLRRTKIAMDYIEELKRTVSDDNYITLVAYKTIDAALLLDSNKSRASLIKAITERDCYYKTIADSAVQSFERYNKLIEELEEEKEKNIRLNAKIEALEEQVFKYKGEIKSLVNELNAHKAVIDTYVYPELANELLAKEGAIRKTASPIIDNALDNNLITSTTNIKNMSKSSSSVIKGLFDTLDE